MSSIVSNIGTWVQRVAQDWLVLQLTGSGTALGIVTGLQFLPSLLFSLLGGSFADRFDKRKLLALTNAGGGIAVYDGGANTVYIKNKMDAAKDAIIQYIFKN